MTLLDDLLFCFDWHPARDVVPGDVINTPSVRGYRGGLKTITHIEIDGATVHAHSTGGQFRWHAGQRVYVRRLRLQEAK